MAKSQKSKQPKTRIKEKQPTRVIERRVTVIQKEKPEKAKMSPLVIIGAVIGGLLLIFLPIFPAQKTVEKTVTVMVPVTKEKQEEVTTDETIKVYQGYLEEKGTQEARTGYNIAYDYWGDPYYVPYTYYETVEGKTITIDAVQEIVEMQQSRGPNDTWVITLTAYDGTQVVYRDIGTQPDLTKTGRATVKVKKTVSTPYTVQEPQQQTKEETLNLHVSLLSLILKNY